MTETAAVILAGGLARRMGGGDKCRQVIGGRSILDRTIGCIRPQVSRLALNANGDQARFADVGLPVLADTIPGHQGPLAGVLAGLDWAAADGADWLLSVPGDCPFLPGDLAARLHAVLTAERADIACAMSGGRTHPVLALWPSALRDRLREALQGGERKIDAFTGRYAVAVAEWPDGKGDPFLNVNTPEDLERANTRASAG